MGNTVGTPTGGVTVGESHLSEAEAERLFREKIGYISIIKNRRMRSMRSQEDGIAGDLVSSLKDVSYSWGTSVTSEVTTPSAVNRSKISNESGYNSKRIDCRKEDAPPGRLRASTASTLSPTHTYITSVASKDVSQATTCTNSHQHSGVKPLPTRHKKSQPSKPSKASTPNRNNRLSPSYPTKDKHRHLSASQSISKKISSETMTTEKALLKDIQAKMIQGELELNSNGKEILQIKAEMETLWAETQQKLEEREKTIESNEATIAEMKREMEKLKAEHKDASAAAHTETTALLRKVTTLQNHLKVVEQERDAALTACEKNEHGSIKATPQEEELNETIQELLKQLKHTEKEHQKEQETLRDEVMLVRRRLERLEGEYIVLERERDSALEKLNATEQKLRLEKAMATADIRQYQDELAMWKERYSEELRFCNRETENTMQKTAVVLGNRLSAGILEGIQEDEELIMTSDDNGVTTARLDDDFTTTRLEDDANSTYSRLMTRLRAVASPVPMTDVTTERVNQMNSNHSHLSQSNSNNYGWTSPVESATTMGSKSHVSRNPNGGFDEAISIPNFLSQVW